MHERLVEGWLDSASERSYQAPFVQMLAAQGHRIIHSTRHSPIELGKDVVTVDKEGTPCGFQLKGNPGGRLTLNSFRDIEPQIRELLNTPISLPGVPSKPHRSFLVTNGYVDEEATHAIEAMNAGYVRDGLPNRQLHVLNRGDLLRMANDLGHSMWPTEVPQLHYLLQMLLESGAGAFPVDRFHTMLGEILGLSDRKDWRAPEVRRRVTSAALMTSISLMNFTSRNNHAAVISAWTQFCAGAIAVCDRYGVSFRNNAEVAVSIAIDGIRDALIDLAKEAIERDDFVEGDPWLTDPSIVLGTPG